MSNKTAEKKRMKGLEDILSQSATLMAHQGYHGTSMRDLAQVTGRSLSGLYHYFDGKEELLFLINQRGFTSLIKMGIELMNKDVSPKERLSGLIHNHVDYFMDHLAEMRVMTSGSIEMDEQRSQLLWKLKDEYATLGQRIVEEYLTSRSIYDHTANEISRKTFLLFGMMNWIFAWYSPKEHGSGEQVADDIFLTFTEGCSTK